MKKNKTSRVEGKRMMMDNSGLVLDNSEMVNETKKVFENQFFNPDINFQYLRGQQKPLPQKRKSDRT